MKKIFLTRCKRKKHVHYHRADPVVHMVNSPKVHNIVNMNNQQHPKFNFCVIKMGI